MWTIIITSYYRGIQKTIIHRILTCREGVVDNINNNNNNNSNNNNNKIEQGAFLYRYDGGARLAYSGLKFVDWYPLEWGALISKRLHKDAVPL